MNQLKGTIKSIQVSGNLSLIDINISGEVFKAIVIDTPEEAVYMKVGREVTVTFKETEVIIGKKVEHQISLRNRLLCTITDIDKGELLSKLTLSHPSGQIKSIITSNAVDSLNLNRNEEVWAMIKTNEVTVR